MENEATDKKNDKVTGKVIGIDLGTTNSCVAIVEGGSAKIIEDSADGNRITPSVIALHRRPRIGGLRPPSARVLLTPSGLCRASSA